MFFFTASMVILPSSDANAQCPMCKASVESAMHEKGNTKGLGLNDGILYLLAAPYLAALIIGGFWYKNYRLKHH